MEGLRELLILRGGQPAILSGPDVAARDFRRETRFAVTQVFASD